MNTKLIKLYVFPVFTYLDVYEYEYEYVLSYIICHHQYT